MENILTEKLNQLYFQESSIEIINEYYNRDIQKIEDLLEEGFIQNKIDKLKDSYDKNIKIVKKILLDNGIDVSRIQNQGLLLGKTVKNDIKNREKPEVIQNKLIKGAAKIIKKEAISAKKSFEEKSLSEKIARSLFIFVIVLFLNTLFGGIFVGFLGAQVGMVVLAVVIAPLVEESAKRLSIIHDHPWIYTGIFAGLELLQYVISLISAGGLLVPVLIVRLLALLMHFSTTFIQKYFKEKGEEKNEQGMENNLEMIGYFLAIGIHVTWNIIGLIMNKKIGAWIGIESYIIKNHCIELV
jgi:tryptophan-rich sensory protein